jgi:hypothetical protein
LSSCPKCGAPINADAFGLITCGSCKAVLSVDLEGTATQVVHEPLPAEDTLSIQTKTAETPTAVTIALPPIELPPMSFQMEPAPSEEQAFQVVDQIQPIPHAPKIEAKADLHLQNQNSSSENSTALTGFQEADSAPQSPKSVFKEIADFAFGFTKPSLLNYTIFLEGVAHKKSEVLGALSEKKFGWTRGELESEISGDRLVLRNLNPAKATMVVKVLQNIPVRISWRQDGF